MRRRAKYSKCCRVSRQPDETRISSPKIEQSRGLTKESIRSLYGIGTREYKEGSRTCLWSTKKVTAKPFIGLHCAQVLSWPLTRRVKLRHSLIPCNFTFAKIPSILRFLLHAVQGSTPSITITWPRRPNLFNLIDSPKRPHFEESTEMTRHKIQYRISCDTRLTKV